MNKKIMIFGILGIFALALVSAGLVGYLSNTVRADVEVTSPMIAGISLGESNWGGTDFPNADWDYTWDTGLTISDVKGGETITLYTMSENLADVEITGFENAIVTSPGITCDDFESVIVRVDSIYGGLGYGDSAQLIGTGGCQQIDYNNVLFGNGLNSDWGAGEADVREIVVTFETNALGTYSVSYEVIPAI